MDEGEYKGQEAIRNKIKRLDRVLEGHLGVGDQGERGESKERGKLEQVASRMKSWRIAHG